MRQLVLKMLCYVVKMLHVMLNAMWTSDLFRAGGADNGLGLCHSSRDQRVLPIEFILPVK